MSQVPSTQVPLKAVAFHEAGHAVVGVLKHRAFEFVTIKVQDDGSVGKTRYRDDRESMLDWLERMESGDASKSDRARCHRLLFTAVAGAAAEDLGTGRHDLWKNDEKDDEDAWDYAVLLAQGWVPPALRSGSEVADEAALRAALEERIEAHVKRAFDKARMRLSGEREWWAIHALTAELLVRRTLESSDARPIIRKALREEQAS